jgi:hypothetical protein
MATMTSDSATSSPVEKELDDEKAYGHRNEEEIEPRTSHDNAETSIAKRKETRNLALHATRSRSSVRSQRSYAGTDGYTHFAHDDDDTAEKGAQGDNTAAEEGTDPDKAFEVAYSGPNDPLSPRSAAWGTDLRRWTIVLILAASSMCVTCASALYTSTYSQIEPEFGISREVATLGLSIFVCGLGLGPMFLSPLSEFTCARLGCT